MNFKDRVTALETTIKQSQTSEAAAYFEACKFLKLGAPEPYRGETSREYLTRLSSETLEKMIEYQRDLYAQSLVENPFP